MANLTRAGPASTFLSWSLLPLMLLQHKWENFLQVFFSGSFWILIFLGELRIWTEEGPELKARSTCLDSASSWWPHWQSSCCLSCWKSLSRRTAWIVGQIVDDGRKFSRGWYQGPVGGGADNETKDAVLQNSENWYHSVKFSQRLFSSTETKLCLKNCCLLCCIFL